jgi:hypothetical protein
MEQVENDIIIDSGDDTEALFIVTRGGGCRSSNGSVKPIWRRSRRSERESLLISTSGISRSSIAS